MTLQQVFEEGRLIRGDWERTDEQGRQLLCLYTALAGDPNARPSTCPASLAPRWLAELLPWLDDSGSDEAWPQLTKRIVALAPKFANMPEATSRRLETEVKLIALREAAFYTDDARALNAINCVMALLVRRSLADEPSEGEWASARDDAARTAYDAARSGSYHSSRAAYYASYAAANASYAAYAAEAAYAASNAAQASADRMHAAILEALEAAL